MGQEFHFRDKVPVALLGATGAVGQKFVELLADHPWFDLQVLAASPNSVGKLSEFKNLKIEPCNPDMKVSLVFSALEPSVAGEIEVAFRKNGHAVISNASSHRGDPNVPILIPEVNSHHMDDIHKQGEKGYIVTNSNCVVAGLALALKPLNDKFGIEAVDVVTLQSLSGAGCKGLRCPDLADNVVPYIQEEERKITFEPLKILEADFKISAQVFRVPITKGHSASVSVRFKRRPSRGEMIEAWSAFRPISQVMIFPSAPLQPIIFSEEKDFPQPKKHLHGMAVSIGQLKEAPVYDWRFVVLTDNCVRGAAGGAILCGEMLLREGKIYW